MSERIEKAQRQIELIFNEISADQKAFRIILQTFLLKMALAQGNQRAAAIVGDMKETVLASIDLTEPAPPEASDEDKQGSERHKQLTAMRAESFFQELEAVINPTEAKAGKPVSN